MEADGSAAEGDHEAKATEKTPEIHTGGKAGGRKRPASYLDELLGQKANKKSKKKNKSAATAGG